MKILQITLFLSGIFFSVLGQKIKNIPIETEKTSKYIFDKKYNLSPSKRLQKYPFNQTTKIKLVSFNGDGGQRKPEDKIKEGMPNLWMEICTKPFKEIKTLNNVQLNRLSDIIYNYGYIKSPKIIDLVKCYAPKNGILFLDANDKTFEFIEICFGCKKVIFSSRRMGESEDFEQPKIELLKKFFKEIGIEYGTTRIFDDQ